jgi:hypothetical protein
MVTENRPIQYLTMLLELISFFLQSTKYVLSTCDMLGTGKQKKQIPALMELTFVEGSTQ